MKRSREPVEMFHMEDEGTKARPRRFRRVSSLQLQWAVKNEKEDLPVRGMEQDGENLGSLIASEEFSDVVIECGEQVFHCHRVILATQSPVFKVLCSSIRVGNCIEDMVLRHLHEAPQLKRKAIRTVSWNFLKMFTRI